MNKFQDHLVAGLIAAVVTGAIAGVVIWKITATQQAFIAQQFAAQDAKVQAVGDELVKTANDLKRLDGALKTTEATLRDVKDQVALVGTRTGIAQLNSLVEAANKTLGEIKQATSPEQTNAALAPLGTQIDAANKTLAPLADKLDSADKKLTALQAELGKKLDDNTRDETLARIETALAGVKDAVAKQASSRALAQANSKLDDVLKSLAEIGKTTDALKSSGTDTAKLDEAAKSLAAIKESLDAIKSRAGADSAKLEAASKSITALDTSVKQGFADVGSKQADVMKAVTKPAPAPAQPAEVKQDLVVFYVSMASKAAAAPSPATTATAGLTPPAPPPIAVQYEEIGGTDDEGQARVIVGKLQGIVKGHSGCAISVAGHADTLGSDKANYDLSKERAEMIAGKLKTAFAGSGIAIKQTQWGERRLKEWTPDGTAREANRRVDIAVSCDK